MAGTVVPDADAMMISARRTRIDPCFPRRTICSTATLLGSGHPHVAIALGNLAYTYSALGRAADALPLEQRALQIRARQEGSGG